MPQPNLNFNGQTYVAFSDLCGFKKMMKNRKEAYEALNYLFNTVYQLLEGKDHIKALAVSDAVISWSANSQLEGVVNFVRKLHKKMIERRFLMKTTIAFGDFQYRNRIELSNLSKEMILGGAYLTAFLRNEKLSAGKIFFAEYNNQILLPNAQMWKKVGKSMEYFWSARTLEEISKIKKERNKAKNLEYERLKDIYQGQISYRETQLDNILGTRQ